MSHIPTNIDCLVHCDGKCLLPGFKTWFGFSRCILVAGDRRIDRCALRVPAELLFRPMERVTPPPKKP